MCEVQLISVDTGLCGPGLNPGCGICVKAETHDATNRCDTSPQQVAVINRLV